MPGQYFPNNDQEFEAFVADFNASLPAVMTSLTLPATFDDAIIAAKTAYTTALAAHVTAQTDAVEKRTTKDVAKDALIAALRNVVNQLRANPGFDDAMTASLGLPVYDTTPSPSQPGSEVPSGRVDTSAPQQHTIYFWQESDEGEESTAKPDWARACRIMRSIVDTGAGAPPIENMTFLATDTASPYTWSILGGFVGKDCWYRLAWETNTGSLGPWSAPVKGTITG